MGEITIRFNKKILIIALAVALLFAFVYFSYNARRNDNNQKISNIQKEIDSINKALNPLASGIAEFESFDTYIEHRDYSLSYAFIEEQPAWTEKDRKAAESTQEAAKKLTDKVSEVQKSLAFMDDAYRDIAKEWVKKINEWVKGMHHYKGKVYRFDVSGGLSFEFDTKNEEIKELTDELKGHTSILSSEKDEKEAELKLLNEKKILIVI